MAHKGNRAGLDSADQRHGDNQDQRTSKGTPPGTIHSISSGLPCPETVLIARMTDGSYLLMAYPRREPATFVTAEDAGSLREALNAAFGTTPDTAVSSNGKHTGAVPQGYGGTGDADHGKVAQVQPNSRTTHSA